MVSLFEANRGAFIEENIHLVREGATLNLPQNTAVAAQDLDRARAMVREHTGRWSSYKRRVAALAQAQETPATASVSGQVVPLNRADPQQAQEDQVRLSDASQSDASTQSIALQREIAELQERNRQLEEMIIRLQTALVSSNVDTSGGGGVGDGDGVGMGDAQVAPISEPAAQEKTSAPATFRFW